MWCNIIDFFFTFVAIIVLKSWLSSLLNIYIECVMFNHNKNKNH